MILFREINRKVCFVLGFRNIYYVCICIYMNSHRTCIMYISSIFSTISQFSKDGSLYITTLYIPEGGWKRIVQLWLPWANVLWCTYLAFNCNFLSPFEDHQDLFSSDFCNIAYFFSELLWIKKVLDLKVLLH